MISTNGNCELGFVNVVTSDEASHTPDQWATLATDRIISISETAPEELKYQAEVGRERMLQCIAYYVSEAVRCERHMLASRLAALGMTETAELIRKDVV